MLSAARVITVDRRQGTLRRDPGGHPSAGRDNVQATSNRPPIDSQEMSESQPLLSQRISDAVPDAIEIPVTEAAKQVSSWTSEFFKFIAKGNVVDLAIGIIIGAAFQDIVKSLVGDIFSPVIGLATGVGLHGFLQRRDGRTGGPKSSNLSEPVPFLPKFDLSANFSFQIALIQLISRTPFKTNSPF